MKCGNFIRIDHLEDNDTSTVDAGSSRTGAEVRFLCCYPKHSLKSQNLILITIKVRV